MWCAAKDQIVLWEYRRPNSYGKWSSLPPHTSEFLETNFQRARKSIGDRQEHNEHEVIQHEKDCLSIEPPPNLLPSIDAQPDILLPPSSQLNTPQQPNIKLISNPKCPGNICLEKIELPENGISVAVPKETCCLDSQCPLQVFFHTKNSHIMYSICCCKKIPIRRTTCQWSWESPCAGTAGKLLPGPWHPFSQKEMLFLEESLRNGRTVVELPESRYEFNLQRRIMTDKKTDQRSRMRRLCQTSNDAREPIAQPDFEETVQSRKFHVSEPSHEELTAVAQHFNGDPNMFGYELCAVHKVHNYNLYQGFDKQKSEMGKAHNQTMLFHGCPPMVIPYILQEGFDFRLYGKNAAVYGNGAYFAKYPSYSHKFSDVGRSKQSDTWQLLVAQVLVGRYAQGVKGMARPPRIHAGGKFYDSLVDSVSDPHVFVIFDQFRAYPDFVMKYRKLGVPQHITLKSQRSEEKTQTKQSTHSNAPLAITFPTQISSQNGATMATQCQQRQSPSNCIGIQQKYSPDNRSQFQQQFQQHAQQRVLHSSVQQGITSCNSSDGRNIQHSSDNSGMRYNNDLRRIAMRRSASAPSSQTSRRNSFSTSTHHHHSPTNAQQHQPYLSNSDYKNASINIIHSAPTSQSTISTQHHRQYTPPSSTSTRPVLTRKIPTPSSSPSSSSQPNFFHKRQRVSTTNQQHNFARPPPIHPGVHRLQSPPELSIVDSGIGCVQNGPGTPRVIATPPGCASPCNQTTSHLDLSRPRPLSSINHSSHHHHHSNTIDAHKNVSRIKTSRLVGQSPINNSPSNELALRLMQTNFNSPSVKTKGPVAFTFNDAAINAARNAQQDYSFSKRHQYNSVQQQQQQQQQQNLRAISFPLTPQRHRSNSSPVITQHTTMTSHIPQHNTIHHKNSIHVGGIGSHSTTR